MVDDKTLPTPKPEERQLIQGYGPGRFRISNATWEQAVLVLPDRTVAWEAVDLAGLSDAALAPILAAVPAVEILIIGSGAKAQFLPPSRRAALRSRGIVCEVMDTGAACRTYNVLLAEGRRLAAALLPLPAAAPPAP